MLPKDNCPPEETKQWLCPEQEPVPIGLDMEEPDRSLYSSVDDLEVDAELCRTHAIGEAWADQEPEPMGVYDEWAEPTECDDWSPVINLCYNHLVVTGPPNQLAAFIRLCCINEDMIDANDDAWDDLRFDANQNYTNHKDFIDFLKMETDTHVERVRLHRSEDGGLDICMDSWRLHVASSVHWMATTFPSLAFDLQTYGDRSASWDQVLFKEGKWIFFHESLPPSDGEARIGTVAAAGYVDGYSDDFEQLRKNYDIDALDENLRECVEDHKYHAVAHGSLELQEFHAQLDQMELPDYCSQLKSAPVESDGHMEVDHSISNDGSEAAREHAYGREKEPDPLEADYSDPHDGPVDLIEDDDLDEELDHIGCPVTIDLHFLDEPSHQFSEEDYERVMNYGDHQEVMAPDSEQSPPDADATHEWLEQGL